ncbi:serine/threonine-protein kinase [Saccharothrix tamanrassetensis]|uniref:non-specific serine/threonine protein kinase n=1 Tax=Saccharothrix tamanrassetensis TaxID=1051531 RepID=A0A841CP34_9PSEU|nr:serine/threonine-protein kinase [Saccharothrix tamanrassetensis]MBB5959059.1 serine/threonine-protein kinase [Saccharothrix tamanrassetensis]
MTEAASPGVIAALPQYDIGPRIGHGGMGVVYAGVHRPLGRPVAVKRLPHVLAEDAAMSARFEREARLLARLDHPHIVPVYDYVQDHGEHLLVMEKLDGGTVWSRFSERGCTPSESCAIALATLSGLHAAHGAGVLHLDVKPKNLLFTAQGALKVADFGISQVVSEGATLVTHGGQVLGTPAYLSPEQALGNPLSPAADVYGTATVLYELLSGRLPFDSGGGALAMIQRHVHQQPRPLTEAEVPAPLARVVMRGVARDPHARYRNAETFAIDLAGAAAEVFGPDWLMRVGLPVHLAPQVASASTRPSTRPSVPRETLDIPVRATTVDALSPPAVLGGQPLVPARDLIERRGPARRLVPAAALLAAVMLALPFTVPDRDLPVLERDLGRPVAVDGVTEPATLRITAAGITLAEATATPPNAFELPGAARWIIGGAALATVESGGKTTEYSLRPTTNPMISVMGAGSAVLLLFTLAYLESLLRSLRRRQSGPAAVVAAAPLGFGLGAAVWFLPSVLLRHEPALLPAVVCGALGLAAAVCTAVATRRAAVPAGR